MNSDREVLGAVRRWRQRRERALREGERSIAQNLAWIGVLGWLIVAPALAGVFGGRWLDRRLDTGIVLTSALCFIGVGVGCALAWRRIRSP